MILFNFQNGNISAAHRQSIIDDHLPNCSLIVDRGQLHHGLPQKTCSLIKTVGSLNFHRDYTPETSIAFENGWWENCFPFGFWDGFLGGAILVLGSVCFGLMTWLIGGGVLSQQLINQSCHHTRSNQITRMLATGWLLISVS